MNGVLCIDNKLAKEWEKLSPYNTIFELTSPRKMAGNNAISKPVISTIANWLASPVETDIEKQKLMRDLFC